jgi:Kyakuja-Dileera-Zisupton transposase
MIDELMAQMWGIFDETGIFLALCQHGSVLVVADMVQSGELCVSSFSFACFSLTIVTVRSTH